MWRGLGAQHCSSAPRGLHNPRVLAVKCTESGSPGVPLIGAFLIQPKAGLGCGVSVMPSGDLCHGQHAGPPPPPGLRLLEELHQRAARPALVVLRGK